MRRKTREYTHVPHSECPRRPVRRPSETEARLQLARDLTSTLWGVNERRAMRLLHLPLMDIALDGMDGIAIAEARDWRKWA